MAMDGKLSGRKASQEDDIDVDHYFLPGGILDTPSHEEDMIGGSLLDEIGGVGNVNLLPAKQMSVSRIVGSEARGDVPSTGAARLEPQGHMKPTGSVIRGGPTRLSVEGTNPMAKEFTPSSSPAPSDVPLEAMPGGPQLHIVSETLPAKRGFSAAVGSEVKTAATESTVQPGLGDRGQNRRHHPGAAWPARATALPTPPGPPSSLRHQQMGVNQGQRSGPPGFPPLGIISERRVQGQAFGGSPGPLQRRERVDHSRHQGSKLGHHTDGTWDPNKRRPSSDAGPQPGGVPYAGRSQRRNRNQGALYQVQSHGQADNRTRSSTKSVTSAGRDQFREDASGRPQRVDQDQVGSKSSSRNRIPSNQSSIRRASHDPTNSSGQDTPPTKVPSRRQEMCVEHAQQQSTADSRPKPPGNCYPNGPAPALSPIGPGQETLTKGAPGRLSSPAKQDAPLAEDVSSDQSEPAFASGGTSNQSPGQWVSNTGERAARQAKSGEDSGGHLQPHVSKEKDKEKARPKKKEEKTYRPGSKVLLGTTAKETSRSRGGSRPSISQRLRVLSGDMRNFFSGIIAAVLRTISCQLDRLHLVGRFLAVLSCVAAFGVSLLSVLIMGMSWLFLLGLRVHSLALKEATGSIHVVVCFLFPYCFQYLVSFIGEWAPHWLPACLWYSFLMQMFCTSNHQYKHSVSSHLVPALRALLPVAFLCEVPSGRSYLLALSGSELLLLSFTLAAVRLRCLFSPIFLLSWSSQVFAIATCGPCPSLQYGQLLVSLASLHAVSMVDVMLNSRFYHARYRAGMSLTNGFRAISSSPRTLLR